MARRWLMFKVDSVLWWGMVLPTFTNFWLCYRWGGMGKMWESLYRLSSQACYL